MAVWRATLVKLVLVAAVLAAPACTRIKDTKGYIADEEQIASIKPGIDNKASVMKTLGRPTLQSEFEANTWYYVSRRTAQFAFFRPKPTAAQVLVVRFDDKGGVKALDKFGLDQLVSVDPSDDKTPTRGKEISVLQQIFGNIGKFSPAGAGGAGGPQ